jgi:hypothetical protein
VPDYIPDPTHAQQDAFLVQTLRDQIDYPTVDPSRLDAKFMMYPVVCEILGLLQSRVANLSYMQVFNCDVSLQLGSPIYVDAANHVANANATDAAHAKVVGFVRSKPTTNTCLVSHFRYASGLSGLTPGAAVYLTDIGGYSATAGTFTKVLGTAISTTEALCEADPRSAQA